MRDVKVREILVAAAWVVVIGLVLLRAPQC